MATGDDAVEKAADTLQTTADKAAERGGVAEKAAQPLADDAEFVRKLKPSLVAERVKEARGSGPNPLVVVGAALALGLFLAKVLDWRSHAHPRD